MTEETTKIEKAIFRVSQKAVIYDESQDKYLVMKSSQRDDASESFKQWLKKYGPWDLPGGHIDAGEENIQEAFYRELKEEAGIEPEDATISGPFRAGYQLNEKNPNPTALVLIYFVRYSGEIELSDEHEAYEWMTYDEIQEHKEIKEWIKIVAADGEKHFEKETAHDKMIRTLAEFDNYKKRSAQQQKDFTKYASEKVIMEMLPVLDNFHAAIGFVPEEDKDSPWLTGIMYIQQQMEKVFEDAGVSAIEISEGDEFNPETMEAISTGDGEQVVGDSAETQKQEQDQKVTKVIQKGYMISDKLLRPARVEIT